ncbi:MAG: hypothetical protein HQ485_14445 [Acidobacteria bacterium]|jgi:hypothetical protein|nr:hypothetical protein [Acidobacteriota bacterium]
MRRTLTVGLLGCLAIVANNCGASAPPEGQAPEAPSIGPRHQPDASITIYAPEQHALYDGRFVISGQRAYMVGGLNDPAGWDHMDNSGLLAHPVRGIVEMDVNEIENTGTFEARLQIPEGDLVITLDRIHEFSPCQNGGVAAYLYEHGSNSGCGDMNWPKTFVYVAGWGYGHATLNGALLYQDHEIHFMVTQGMRDRTTLAVKYPPASQGAGAVNPATQQLDFYIRSPELNPANTPGREVFAHFFATEVTWK